MTMADENPALTLFLPEDDHPKHNLSWRLSENFKTFSSQFANRFIWSDAICINQCKCPKHLRRHIEYPKDLKAVLGSREGEWRHPLGSTRRINLVRRETWSGISTRRKGMEASLHQHWMYQYCTMQYMAHRLLSTASVSYCILSGIAINGFHNILGQSEHVDLDGCSGSIALQFWKKSHHLLHL